MWQPLPSFLLIVFYNQYFADKKNSVIGIAHAGWRGALNGVLTSTINKMEVLGAERKQISAVIGPCISQAAYEVDLDFFL